jgi:hypothetical protein
VDSTPDSPSPTTAREYLAEHRGKVMVLNKTEGQPLRSEDFFLVESVGSHPTGLVITGIFKHSRRQRLRVKQFRLATELEVASNNS